MYMIVVYFFFIFFFFNDTATTEIYTLSLHDALPISGTPWNPKSASVFNPNGSCTPLGQLRPQPILNSLTNLGVKIWFQPMDAPWPFMVRRPFADELVPSRMPPKVPGTKRKRWM